MSSTPHSFAHASAAASIDDHIQPSPAPALKDDGLRTATGEADADPLPPRKEGAVYIDWERDDPEHPQNWPARRKWMCAVTVMTFSFASACMSSGYGLAYSGVNKDLGPVSYTTYEAGITVYLMGIAFAPMVLAPVSETFGRYPVMMVAAFGNLVLFLGQTLAQNVATIIVTRFLQGCVGSVGNSMSGGYFADMFNADQRGFVLSTYALCLFAAQSCESRAQ